MKITCIRARVFYTDNRLAGYAAVLLDGVIAISGIKILKSNDGGYFMGMPSFKRKNGSFEEIAYPIVSEVRCNLENMVVAAYLNCIENNYYYAEFVVNEDCEKSLVEQSFGDFTLGKFVDDAEAKSKFDNQLSINTVEEEPVVEEEPFEEKSVEEKSNNEVKADEKYNLFEKVFNRFKK